jgi:hypothetical protein
MQSTDECKRHRSMTGIASMPRRRERMRSALKAAMEAWTRPGFLVLLCLASLTYIAFDGTFEASSSFEPETSIAAVAVKPGDPGNAPRDENLLGLFATPVEKLLLSSGAGTLYRDGNR